MKPHSRASRKSRPGLVAALALLTGTAHALEPSDLAPAGDFANLETHRLYFDCRGEGSPRVLFDYGIAGAAVEWQEIQRSLATDTTVCVYDRAGYGWSDPGPSPRTAAQAAAEIAALAAAEGWREPLLLVGHSFGGFDVRYFAARNPAAVAGLVLLDSSLPGLDLSSVPAGTAAGVAHPLAGPALDEEPGTDGFAIARYLNSRRKAVFTQMDELANFAHSGAEVVGAGALPDVPVVVVTRDPARGLPDPAGEAKWQHGQRQLAAGIRRAEWWPAAGSGHEIHRDRPDLVVAAVRRVLVRLRAGPAS